MATAKTTDVISTSQKLSEIQVRFKANKSRFNSFAKYNFRSAEDILEGLKPFNKEFKVYFTISEKLVSIDPPIIESVATMFDVDSQESISSSAIVGVDLMQKGLAVPQQYGSASSYAKKYALGNLLLIDDTQDADATNEHKKMPIPKDRFEKALKSISEGKYSKEALLGAFELTEDQLKQLK
jgi:hypothetical protein